MKNSSLNQIIGITEAVLNSYSAVDKSELSFEQKRGLLFSLYSFRCLFDNGEMQNVNPILKKYFCTFSMPIENHPNFNSNKDDFEEIIKNKTVFIPYGGLYVEENKKYVLRFDAGSELHTRFVGGGKITGISAQIPKKLPLFKMVDTVLSLPECDNTLKALWYLTVPYIVLIGAPNEPQVLESLFSKLISEDVFSSVLLLPHSIQVIDSKEELDHSDLPQVLKDWFLPYIEFKNSLTKNGVTREVERYHLWLKEGKFLLVLEGTEKLLDTFPDDVELLLVNIAVRVSLCGSSTENEHIEILKDTVNVINACLEIPSNKKHFFLYYLGVALLGLRQIDEAEDCFKDSLELAPSFEPSILMLRALKERKKE